VTYLSELSAPRHPRRCKSVQTNCHVADAVLSQCVQPASKAICHHYLASCISSIQLCACTSAVAHSSHLTGVKASIWPLVPSSLPFTISAYFSCILLRKIYSMSLQCLLMKYNKFLFVPDHFKCIGLHVFM